MMKQMRIFCVIHAGLWKQKLSAPTKNIFKIFRRRMQPCPFPDVFSVQVREEDESTIKGSKGAAANLQPLK